MLKILPISNGQFFDSNEGSIPYVATCVRSGVLELSGSQTHMGMIAGGILKISDRHGTFDLTEGMYFCISEGQVRADSPDASVLIISSPFRGLRLFGGPIEGSGRLKYVSGCSDTLLISPTRRGDPCLNHLHIPPQVLQERHYHPSDRVGIILRGSGMCHTQDEHFDLRGDMAWRIPAGMDHSFESGPDGLDVMTWHPDSDFGPTDEDHPMINRTWLR